ncbi:MAG: DUF4249 domain-containing protein [Flavobacteriales bacterium]
MKKLLKILLFTVVVGCQTVIEMDIDETESRLSVYGFLDPSSEAVFKIDASKGILESGDLESIHNAVIRVESDHGVIYNLQGSTFELDPKTGEPLYLYKAGFNPIPGEGYTVYASANGYESVVAKTEIPQRVNITRVDTGRRKIYGYDQAFLNITFQDDGAIKNYYKVSVSLATLVPIQIDSVTTVFEPCVGDAYAYPSDESLLGGGYGQLIISDELFNGQEYTIGMLFSSVLDACEIDSQYIDSVPVYVIAEVTNLSEDSYKFWSSYYKQLGAGGDPFAQPVQVYSNVESGFGCVGGQATSADTVLVTTNLVTIYNYNDYLIYEGP